MTESDKNIFDLYDAAVVELGGVTKTRAKKLSEIQPRGTISHTSITKLYESLACDGWKKQVGTNWDWRDKVPDHTDGYSDEVSLERTVAARDVARWACQMSTSSGVQGAKHRRRAIDLVRFIGPHHYAFVELKVGSDNPLYAAFEILGYALAYLHARANGWAGTGKHNVFDAEAIELTVLGPVDWYMYDKRGTDKQFEYELDWLAGEITKSLNEFVTTEFKGKPIFTVAFREFPDGDRELQATEIHRLAEREWWKA